MTVWSPSTASGDPTSPSSPTLPVGRPKRLSYIPLAPPSPLSPHPTALSKDRGHVPVLPALSVDAVGWTQHYNLQVVFYRKEEIQDKNKDNCGCSVLAFED